MGRFVHLSAKLRVRVSSVYGSVASAATHDGLHVRKGFIVGSTKTWGIV